MVTIGVLALQGDVAEHVRALENSGARALLVRRQLLNSTQVDGLVIPGGESTTMSNLLLSFGLFDALNARISVRHARLRDVRGHDHARLRRSWTDAKTSVPSARSTWSCAATPLGARWTPTRRTWTSRDWRAVPSTPSLSVPHGLSRWARESRSLRAPVTVPTVRSSRCAAVSVMATSFHPEVGGDDRIHGLFVDMVARA